MRTRCDVLRDLCCRLRPCVARLFAESAARCLEPLSLGLIKFRTWHLRIRKNMKYKSQRSAGEDVWGGPAVLLAPGQARSTPARIFPQSSRTNTTPKSPCKAAGRPVGSACGFLSRTDAGQVRLEPTANGTWRETSLNHRHFVDAHRYRMPLHAQGGFRGDGEPDRLVCWHQRVQARESKSQTTLHSSASHCSQLVLIALEHWHSCELWLSS